jgi:hypothetical protein
VDLRPLRTGDLLMHPLSGQRFQVQLNCHDRAIE